LYSKTTSDMGDTQKIDDRQTDIKRLMFQLNQVKEEIAEAELRATAAEQRVISLKKQTDQMETKDNSQLTNLKIQFEKQTESLTEKVRNFADALQKLKLDTHKEIMDVKSSAAAKEIEFATEKQKLETTAVKAESDLREAKEEIKDFQKDRSEFADGMTRAKLQAHTELVTAQNEGRVIADSLRADIAGVTASLQQANIDIGTITQEADRLEKNKLELEEQLEKQNFTYEKHIAEVENKVKTSAIELENTTRTLKQEMQDANMFSEKTLESVKLDMTQQLLLSKEMSQREKEQIIAEKDAEISDKEGVIVEYEVELASVRKLTKQSLRLVRERVVTFFKRKNK